MDTPDFRNVIVVTAVVAFAVTYLLVPWTIRISRRIGAMDQPDARRVHDKATGRLGGLAIIGGVLTALLLNAWEFRIDLTAYLIGVGILLVTGLIDDIRGTHPLAKFAGQLAAASAVVLLGMQVEMISTFEPGKFLSLGALRVPLSLLWILSLINMINFLDGLDGLAAGVCTIACFALALVNLYDKLSPVSVLMLTALGASCLAFLRFNFHPARIFMGDTGSMFLGFTIAVSSMLGAFKGATLAIVLVPMVVLLLPIFDMIFAIFRRVTRDAPVFRPDKEHIHHQFLKLGYSHRRAVLSIWTISALLGGAAIFISQLRTMLAAFLLFGLSALLAFSLIVFFQYGERPKTKDRQEGLEKADSLPPPVS